MAAETASDLLAGYTTIGNLCDDGVAHIQTGPFGSQLHAHDYRPVGTPVIPTEAIGRGRILNVPLPKVGPDVAARLSRHALQEGDILFARRGAQATGLSAIVEPGHAGSLCSTGAILLRFVDRSRVLPQYLALALSDQGSVSWLKDNAVGAVMPNLNADIIRRLPVRIPSLVEQRAIAHILGTIDDKIELNRRTNETLEAMARALFKSWFVDFDPVHAKATGRQPREMDAETAALFPSDFVDSEMGEIPEGWRATTLGAEVNRCGGAIQTGPFGSQLHASDYLPAGVPVVMPKDISGRRVSTDTIARIGENDADRLSRHRLQLGDVVYSRRGDVERHALISRREVGWLCGTGCLLVRLGARWPSPMFASFALDRPETRAWISQHAIGATMPNLNTGILSAVPVVMPTHHVLGAFARAVDQLQSLVVSRDAENAMLAQARDALLPRLLSGELTIPNAKRIARAAT